MKYRKLRNAWSVAWGIVAVLLIALWVRSNWRRDYASGRIGYSLFIVDSNLREICLSRFTTVQEAVAFEMGSGDSGAGDYPKTVLGFGYDWEPGIYCHFLVSHLFIAIFTALFGLVPWLSWAKRFSLRTLLVVTTVVAVGLGMIAWAAH
ncbi:MAG TPA: hypothetical protein VHU84_09670 [Lacipirellulaceae bacterium]|jgi:hypothetical protein|nr:hypothetical protein [Lacipirellulaceae bacterium]